MNSGEALGFNFLRQFLAESAMKEFLNQIQPRQMTRHPCKRLRAEAARASQSWRRLLQQLHHGGASGLGSRKSNRNARRFELILKRVGTWNSCRISSLLKYGTNMSARNPGPQQLACRNFLKNSLIRGTRLMKSTIARALQVWTSEMTSPIVK